MFIIPAKAGIQFFFRGEPTLVGFLISTLSSFSTHPPPASFPRRRESSSSSRVGQTFLSVTTHSPLQRKGDTGGSPYSCRCRTPSCDASFRAAGCPHPAAIIFPPPASFLRKRESSFFRGEPVPVLDYDRGSVGFLIWLNELRLYHLPGKTDILVCHFFPRTI